MKTTAKTLPELRNSIKTKIEIDESTNIRLYFKDNGKYIVLNDMEDLEDGTIIKVSTVSAQPQQNVITHGKFTFFFFFSFIYLFCLFV